MNSGLKVLFLTQTYPRHPDDTAGPFIRDLAEGLVAGGDAVTVLTPHAEGLSSFWHDGGVEVHTFRYAPERLELVGYSRSLEKDEAVRRGAAAITPLFVAGARRKLRALLREREFDLVQAHWVVPNALIAAPVVGNVPMGVGLHGSDVFMAEKPILRRLTAWALARASFLTGCSPELVDRVCALGFDRETADVIPYGVDTRTFSPRLTPGAKRWRQEFRISADAPLVLSVGRMVSKKGFHVLLEVLPALLTAHPSAHFVLAGAGDLLAEFRTRTAKFSNRVHLPGIVMRDRLPDLYRTADLFVLPAVHDDKGNVDGLPNVILEAMASGLGVVASEISGIPQAVRHEENGVLVPEQSPRELEAALSSLLSHPEKMGAMGRESRRRAEQDLTWQVIAGRYRQAYVDGLERSARIRAG